MATALRGYRGTNGYALVTALMFLLILTGVAITALRSTGLELRMSSNYAIRTEAFEASEGPRLLLLPILEAHAFSRGWPKTTPSDASFGGSIEPNLFDYTIPAEMSITKVSGKPRDWYVSNSEKDAAPSFLFNPMAPANLAVDASYARDITPSGSATFRTASTLSVYKLRTDINPGSGAAMVSGYEGVGKATAAAGANVFFYVQSNGTDPSTESSYLTGSSYRHVIRN